MAALLIGSRVLLTFEGKLNGQTILTTFLYKCTAVGDTATDDAILASLVAQTKTSTGIYTKYVNVMPQSYIRGSIWSQVVWPIRYRKVVTPQIGNGLNAVNTDTQNIQGSITRAGAQAHRYDVGGVRIPVGTSQDAIEEGLLTNATKALLEELADAMKLTIITPVGPATFIPQVGCPKGTKDHPRDFGDSVDVFTTFVQPEVRVMPRRTVGRGI